MTSRFYASSILLLLAIASGWLVWRMMDLHLDAPANPHTPDTFVNQLEITAMDETGARAYQFNSPNLLHYAENDRTTFTQPHLILFENNAPPWTIDALQGEALQGDAQVKLSGNIIMTQPAGKNNQSTVIKTASAILYPQVRRVTTDQFISLVQPTAHIQGVGMKLDAVRHTLDLLSHVQGYYAQPSKPTVYITAHQAHLDKAANTGFFEGSVKLTQDKNSLNTNKLNLFFDKNKQLIKAIATGEGTVYQTRTDPAKPPFIATAQMMQYFPPLQKIILTGNAQATQGPNSYAAPQIEYYIDKQTVLSPSAAGSRTTIVITPQSFQH